MTGRAGAAFALLLAALASARAAVVPVRTWTPPAPLAAFPEAVDLGPLLSAPPAQGLRNTCSVFAAAGLGEFLWKSVRGEEIKLSEQHLYYSAKRNFTGAPELRVYRRIDGLPGFAAVKALSGGVVPAEAWPYEGSSAQDGETTLERITGRPPAGIEEAFLPGFDFSPVRIPQESIKHYLLIEKKPVVFNIMWYFNAADPATGRLRAPTVEERRLCLEEGRGCGGHVVLLTGYDPATDSFQFRNSWGPGWGKGGFGSMPASYVTVDCEMCRHAARRASFPAHVRRLIDNAVHGWSGELKSR